MIFDNIKHCEKYFSCHEKFEAGFAFIKKVMEENLPAGRYDLDGAELYAFVQEYTTKLESEARLEGHNAYIDIQCLIAGDEMMATLDVDKGTVMIPYDGEKDISFWENNPKVLKAIFAPGDFAVFFPHDLHMPGVCLDGVQTPVKKVVVKVKA